MPTPVGVPHFKTHQDPLSSGTSTGIPLCSHNGSYSLLPSLFQCYLMSCESLSDNSRMRRASSRSPPRFSRETSTQVTAVMPAIERRTLGQPEQVSLMRFHSMSQVGITIFLYQWDDDTRIPYPPHHKQGWKQRQAVQYSRNQSPLTCATERPLHEHAARAPSKSKQYHSPCARYRLISYRNPPVQRSTQKYLPSSSSPFPQEGRASEPAQRSCTHHARCWIAGFGSQKNSSKISFEF